MKKEVETIKSLISQVLEKMTVSGSVEVMESDECTQFIIRTNEAGILIGEGGQNLIALSHLIKKITESEFRKNNWERIQFLLDVNDYQAKKIEELKNTAKMGAQRARYFKKEVMMNPMTAYERRIIHSALTEYPDIETMSEGEGLNRKVIIKFIDIE
jgi:spoIIIJ-associated protein